MLSRLSDFVHQLLECGLIVATCKPNYAFPKKTFFQTGGHEHSIVAGQVSTNNEDKVQWGGGGGGARVEQCFFLSQVVEHPTFDRKVLGSYPSLGFVLHDFVCNIKGPISYLKK